MRIALRETSRTSDLAYFEATIPAMVGTVVLRYRTRTGAILWIDGVTAGAFDREHTEVEIARSAGARTLRLQVELEGLPTSGLPSRGDLRWWWMLARSHPEPSSELSCELSDAPEPAAHLREAPSDLVLWGHSHLDVAWLWTYEQTRRKAVRTFSNAMALLERDPSFIFAQSQPQLYAFVEADDPELFARIRARAREGRFDPDVAAFWVEPDCNLPSGESLLRQMLYANRFCREHFGTEPTIAWLPDSFGFTRTLPTLLAHAGIGYFATTKLQWNDTTRFPFPQFRWRGPDGSEVIGALIDSYDGGPDSRRTAIARERNEPLVIGYGDGGGGPTLAQVAQAERIGGWERPHVWFRRLNERRASLPVHDDELYLEFHRGVYTTHHDVKQANAWMERMLSDAEERAAWCVAVRASGDIVVRLRDMLDRAWKIVLRNQLHDVLPGTSIRAVYKDVQTEYDQARELVQSAIASTRAILPRAPRHERMPSYAVPSEDDGDFIFDNGLLRARISASGSITDLAAAGCANVAAAANLLAAYRDRPRQWEAWNIDDGYQKHRIHVRPKGAQLAHDGVDFRFLIGRSPATMRIALEEGAPFLRVDLTVDWRERKTLLRTENWLLVETQSVRYGAAHGTVERSAMRGTPEARARFEVPGPRFAMAQDGSCGLAILALDTYGWSARALPKGGLQLGHSLLRSTTWPDADADIGEQRLSWAYLPFANAGVGGVERAWEIFARPPRVRLFQCDDEAILIAACKPAHDGSGVIVRVRECGGEARRFRLRCGARMRAALPVDGIERPISGEAEIVGEELRCDIAAFGLRSFRILF